MGNKQNTPEKRRNAYLKKLDREEKKWTNRLDSPLTFSVIKYLNGVEYEGQVNYWCRSGKGTLKFVDGSRYDGCFKDDEYNGKGRFTFPSGGYYEGDFRHNEMCGRGAYFDKTDFKIFEGTFSYFVGPLGNGTFFYRNGAKLTGSFSIDLRRKTDTNPDQILKLCLRLRGLTYRKNFKGKYLDHISLERNLPGPTAPIGDVNYAIHRGRNHDASKGDDVFNFVVWKRGGDLYDDLNPKAMEAIGIEAMRAHYWMMKLDLIPIAMKLKLETTKRCIIFSEKGHTVGKVTVLRIKNHRTL